MRQSSSVSRFAVRLVRQSPHLTLPVRFAQHDATALQMTCYCQLTALLGARLTSSVRRQAVGAGRNSKNERCVALLFTNNAPPDCATPCGWVIGRNLGILKCAREFSSEQWFAPLACPNANSARAGGPQIDLSRHTVGPHAFWNGHGSRLIPRLTGAESPPHHPLKTAVPLGRQDITPPRTILQPP